MKMPKLYLALTFILSLVIISCNTNKNLGSTTNTKGALFEGVIKYKFLMEDASSMSEEDIEAMLQQMEPMLGRHMVYYVKDNKLKSIIDGNFMKLHTFNDGSDSMYIHSPDLRELSKVSTYDNWNFKYDTIIKTKNAKVINNQKCDLISFQSDLYTWDYYYSDNLKVDPENYKHMKATFSDIATQMTHSLPMRFDGKIPGGYIYMEAEEILPQTLDPSIFEVPEMEKPGMQ